MASEASPPPSRLRRTLITTLKVGMYGSLIGLIALIVAVGVAMGSLPSYQELVKRDDLGQMIRVRAADGSVLVALGPSFGEWLSYEQIPDIMKDAMVAVEDKRFRSHIGVDPIGLARAARVRVSKGRWTQGGSTITQQLARNIFLTNKRSYGRKMREAILALALERRFSKEQILELYLNRVYFGGGAYGIDAASRRFFGHSAETLTLSEAAIIAGLVKAPSNYSPTADAEAARERSKVVIALMREQEYISAAEAATTAPADVQLVTPAKQNSVRYFTDWVLPQLDTLIDESVEPIEVWTTLDPNMQRLGDQVINANTPAGGCRARWSRSTATVGTCPDRRPQLCRFALQSRHPGDAAAGPAFKLFVYLAALSGYTPDVRGAIPVTINGWSPATTTQLPGRSAAPGFRPSINTDLGSSARKWASARGRHGPTLRLHTKVPPTRDVGTRSAADRHDRAFAR
jgi:penicillin-binding protein 1A